jgi:hypothetical protein
MTEKPPDLTACVAMVNVEIETALTVWRSVTDGTATVLLAE